MNRQPTILIIDDDRAPTELYARALRQSGFHVDTCSEVSDALKRIKEAVAPDLFIVDIMMPPGDSSLDLRDVDYGLTTGLELVRRIRAKHPEAMVIILTAVASPEILASISQDQALRPPIVLAKLANPPFTLVERVKDMLRVL